MLGEHHHFAQGTVDLIVLVLPAVKIFGQITGRQIGRDAFGVNPAAGAQDGVVIQIGGEDLDFEGLAQPFQHFAAQHRQRVSLLAGGAARHPESHLARFHALEQPGQMVAFQFVEHFAVAEKIGDSDQQLPVKRHDFAGVAVHELHVIAQVVNLIHRHPSLDPPDHGIGLVMGEIDPRALAQQRENPGQSVLVGPQGRELPRFGVLGNLNEGQQALGHVLGRQNEIGQSRGDRRARHAVEAGRFLALHQYHPAGFLDRANAAHAVAAGAG